MNGYLLQRDDGAFVARVSVHPSGSSYTRSLLYAEVYPTREHAERDRCVDNERIVSLDAVMLGGAR